MVQSEDVRTVDQQKAFPWWWRNPNRKASKTLKESYQQRLGYEYELGRRYLLHSSEEPKIKAKELPPMSWLCKDSFSVSYVMFLYYADEPGADSSVVFHEHPVFSNSWNDRSFLEKLARKCGKKLTIQNVIKQACAIYEERESAKQSGNLTPSPRMSWDLGAPWESVGARLREAFENERKQKNVTQRQKPGTRNQKPKWTPIESWDLWQTNQTPTERLKSVHSHERSYNRAKASGKTFADFAYAFRQSVAEIAKVRKQRALPT